MVNFSVMKNMNTARVILITLELLIVVEDP